MRFIAGLALIALVFATSAEAVRPKWHQLQGYTFEQYVADFHKTYKSTEERELRRKVFTKKLADIQAHNADKSQTWKAGVNHMTDFTAEEMKSMNGGRLHQQWKTREQLRAKPYVKKHQVSSTLPFPPKVDYRNTIPSILSAIKDQGMCGSCWAHGSTETVESYYAMATGEMYALSQQQVTACAPNPNDCGGTGGCGGSIIELAWDYLIQAGGQAQEWTYPYTAYDGTTGTCNSQSIIPVVSLTGYTAVESNSQEAVVDALARVGPLAINVDASLWGSYEHGVFSGCNYAKNISIDHVVQLVGYGTDDDTGLDYWIVRNSWSPAWGENGFIRLLKGNGQDCGWDVDPQDGTGCNGGPKQLWTCGQCGILFDTLYPIVQTASTGRKGH